jgi:hypothetical protein
MEKNLFFKMSKNKMRTFFKASPGKTFFRNDAEAVLPDSTIWVNFEGSCNGRCWYQYFMAIWYIFPVLVYLFCGHLVYFSRFGVFYGHLVFFPVFGMLYKEKSGNLVQKCKSLT